MDTRQCLEILELESITSPEELKQAYRDKVQVWHPDRFHGNSRLQDIASEKLSEINSAYHHLRAYFDPEKRRKLKESASPAYDQPSDVNETFERARQSSARDDAGREMPGQFNHIKAYPARKKSFIGRLFLFLGVCVLLMSAGAIVYFVLNMDQLSTKSIGAASEVLESFKVELEKDIASKLGGEKSGPIDSTLLKKDETILKREINPAETKKFFEIYLEGGSTIMTASWWEEGDMIMYTQYGGSMGVEKSRVKRIVERQVSDSDLPF